MADEKNSNLTVVKSEEEQSYLTVVNGSDDSGDYGDQQIISIADDKEFGDLRREIVELRKNIDGGRWELAKRLLKVRENGLYKQWGIPTWEKFVNNEVGLSVRTADLLASIYVFFGQTLAEKIEEPEEREGMIEAVKSLGWTKAKHLVDVCNVSDYSKWIELARKITVSELETEVKKSLATQHGGDESDVSPMKTKSYKFSSGQLDMVEQAIEIAEKTSGSKKKSHNMALVCQSFVADNMAQGDNVEENRNKMLRRVAAEYGVDIIVVDPDSKRVLMGQKLLDALKKANK